MGFYINAPEGSEETKEQILARIGTLNSVKSILEFDFDLHPDELPVCLVANLLFSAAGVMYSEAGRDVFTTSDGRTKQYYTVKKIDLINNNIFTEDEIDRMEKRR